MSVSEEDELVVRYQHVFTPEFLELLRNDGLLIKKMNREDSGSKLTSMLNESLVQYNKKEKIYRNELRLALTTILIEAMKEYSMVFMVSDKDKVK